MDSFLQSAWRTVVSEWHGLARNYLPADERCQGQPEFNEGASGKAEYH